MDILTSEHLVAKGTFDAVSLLNSSTNPIFQQFSTTMSIIVHKNDYEDFDETIADMNFHYWMEDADGGELPTG
jgi:hypothetical protein